MLNKEGLTIDRIDNKKGYYPENCMWSTAKEQANNRRTNLVIEHKGTQKNLTQWAELYGLNTATVFSRYYRGVRGEGLFKPAKRRNAK